jgi:hypothetical protein
MFKILLNAIKLKRLHKLLSELCDGNSCRNCASLMPDRLELKKCCAQSLVIDQALNKWGPKKEE